MDDKDARYYVVPCIIPGADIYSVLVVSVFGHSLEDMAHVGQVILPKFANSYIAYLSHNDKLGQSRAYTRDIALIVEELYLTTLCQRCKELYAGELKDAGTGNAYEIMAKRKPWVLLQVACGFSNMGYGPIEMTQAFEVAASGSFLVRKLSDTEYAMRYIPCLVNARTSSITVIYEGINGSECTAREIDYIFREDIEPYHQGMLGWNRGVLELTNVKRLIDYATGKIDGITVTVEEGPLDEE